MGRVWQVLQTISGSVTCSTCTHIHVDGDDRVRYSDIGTRGVSEHRLSLNLALANSTTLWSRIRTVALLQTENGPLENPYKFASAYKGTVSGTRAVQVATVVYKTTCTRS